MSPDIAAASKTPHSPTAMPDDLFKTSPHSPPNLFRPGVVYMMTGAIYKKYRLMQLPARKAELRDAFLKASELYRWQVIAWAVLDNHFHILAGAPEGGAANLPSFIGSFHKWTARHWNSTDQSPGRRVWHNYWDTCIRTERDFLSGLKYVLWNPVKHGLVETTQDYPFSNYEDCMQSWEAGLISATMNEVKDVPEY